MPPFGENFNKNISLLAFSMGCIPSHLSSQIHFFQTPQFRRLSGKFIISISKPDGLLSAGSLRKGWQSPFRWKKLLYWQHSTIVIEFDIGVEVKLFWTKCSQLLHLICISNLCKIVLFFYIWHTYIVHCVLYTQYKTVFLAIFVFLMSADSCILSSTQLFFAGLVSTSLRLQKYWGSCPAIMSQHWK